MEDPRTTPSLSLAEAEGFFATGSDARSAAPGLEPGSLSQAFVGSPGGSGGSGAAGKTESLVGAGGPANQADGFAGVAESGLRCGECGNFRHASPRHKAHCRYAGSNCPGCAYATGEHIASCPIATQLKLPTDTCCDGVDLPSIGTVHSPDCLNPRPVARVSVTYQPGVARPQAASRGKVRAYVSQDEVLVGIEGNYVQVSLNGGWTTHLLTREIAVQLQVGLAVATECQVSFDGGAR